MEPANLQVQMCACKPLQVEILQITQGICEQLPSVLAHIVHVPLGTSYGLVLN